MYFTLPPHLTNALALPGETGNPEIASFHLNAACFLTKKTQNIVLKYHLVRAQPPFTVKTIDWVHHVHRTWEESIASCCLLPTCCVLTKSVMVLVAV